MDSPSTALADRDRALTRSEQALLLRIAEGMTIQQAAHDIGISYDAGRKHLSNAYGKLGVANQTQAIIALLNARP